MIHFDSAEIENFYTFKMIVSAQKVLYRRLSSIEYFECNSNGNIILILKIFLNLIIGKKVEL